MQISHFDVQLDLLESQCHAVQASLLTGNAEAVQSGGKILQQLTVQFAQMVGEAGLVQSGLSGRMQRIKVLAAGIATLREGLLRQLAYAERGLEIVVPAMREKATYATGGPYGSPVRQSGSLSSLSA